MIKEKLSQRPTVGYHFMRILISISSLFFLFACNQADIKKQKSKLQIAIDANYRKYLDYPFTQMKDGDSVYYDSIRNQTISVFDSLRNGKIDLFIFSLLTNDIEQKINLQKDTTIYFDTTLYSNFKTKRNLNGFMNFLDKKIDTLFIGQKVIGCYGGSIEKIIICKSIDGYNITYKESYNNGKIQNLSISDTLFNRHYFHFLKESKKFFPEKNGDLTFFNLSTTHINTYIRQGSDILEFPDLYDWKGYEHFKKDLGIINLRQ